MDDSININKKSDSVMFTIRIERDVADFYDELAAKSNHSRNELIGIALKYAMDKFNII